MKYLTSLCLIGLFYFNGNAQAVLVRRTLLFGSGRSQPDTADIRLLHQTSDSLRADGSVAILVEGHADKQGSRRTNFLLSRRRAIAVRKELLSAGINRSDIRIRAWGPDWPVADNRTSAGRQLNRRVDITFLVSAGSAEPPAEAREVDQPQTREVDGNIDDLYPQLATPLQHFCIDRSRDTTLHCAKGTVIFIRANSLAASSGCGCISFNVREDLEYSDMILDNLSTTSDSALLETQGMVYTEAIDCRGNRLQLQKDIVIAVPTDSVITRANIFGGARMHDSVMNWKPDSAAALSSISLPRLLDCTSLLCGLDSSDGCYPCKFFFCRVGRIGKAAGGLFSKRQKAANAAFAQCQKRLRQATTSASRTASAGPPSACGELKALLDRMGIKGEDLIKGAYQPLFDSFRVTTVAQLLDTLKKVETRRIELLYRNRKISVDDLKFYVYNRPTLGWSNIDCFSRIPSSQLTNLSINLELSRSTSCKLVFKERRAIMPALWQKDGKFYFMGIPRNEKATVVAIKEVNGHPLLAMKEVNTSDGTVELEFKSLPLDELKQQLKKLDE